eukprot:4949020-Heterocapsa_arctica.AAC.1
MTLSASEIASGGGDPPAPEGETGGGDSPAVMAPRPAGGRPFAVPEFPIRLPALSSCGPAGPPACAGGTEKSPSKRPDLV